MESQKPAPSSDEIDLQDIAVKAILYFKKHFWFIAISTLVGILFSIIAYVMLPKVYQSRMIVMSDILTESYSKEITESLKNLIKERNISTLAPRLGLTEQEVSDLQTIEIESVKKEKVSEKDVENTIFIITAEIKNRDILPKLQGGLIQFLRENEFVRIRVRQRKEMFQKLIEKIGFEINSLDSLKRRLFSGQPIYSKSSEMMLVDPTNIYSKIIELNKEQINLKNALELSDSIQLVEGFTIFQKPAQPKLSILLVIGFLGGLFLSIGTLTVMRLFKLANS
jgi:hypothetical protein